MSEAPERCGICGGPFHPAPSDCVDWLIERIAALEQERDELRAAFAMASGDMKIAMAHLIDAVNESRRALAAAEQGEPNVDH